MSVGAVVGVAVVSMAVVGMAVVGMVEGVGPGRPTGVGQGPLGLVTGPDEDERRWAARLIGSLVGEAAFDEPGWRRVVLAMRPTPLP